MFSYAVSVYEITAYYLSIALGLFSMYKIFRNSEKLAEEEKVRKPYKVEETFI